MSEKGLKTFKFLFFLFNSDSNSDSETENEACDVCGHEGELAQCVHCEFKCHAECAKPPMKKARVKNWKCWKCTSVQQRSERIKRRRIDRGGAS